MKCRRISSVLLVTYVMSALSAISDATIWYVDATIPTPGGNGLSWCVAFTDLQDAITAATAGDTIRVADGIYSPDRGVSQTLGDRLSTFRLKSGVSLMGGYAGCGAVNPDARDFNLFASTLSGDLNADDGPGFTNRNDNTYHVMHYDDPTAVNVVIDGFTIQSGHADGTGPAGTLTNQGSAIHVRDESTKCIPGGPLVRNCTIQDNWSADHGAFNDHGLGTQIENCTFRDNYSGKIGGGLLIFSGSTSVTDCVFENNLVLGEGGGAWTGSSQDFSCTTSLSRPTFTDCTFTGNTALYNGGLTGSGGGLFNEFNSPIITRCTFLNNDADVFGGGVHGTTTQLQISESVFTNNTSLGHPDRTGSGAGGGVWTDFGGFLSVTQCTFNGNVASLYGAGVHAGSGFSRITDSTFTANTVTVSRGAGIRVATGTAEIVGCTFDSNDAINGGAGIEIEANADAVVLNCIFRKNIAGFGGGIAMLNASATVTNSTFTGHSNALKLSTATATFTNCTFTGNTIVQGATARFLSAQNSFPSTVDFVNCILWDSTNDIQNNDASLVTFTNCNVLAGWPGTGNVTLNPMFVNASGPDGVIGTSDDNLRLSLGSPAMNAGDSSALPDDLTDLDDDGLRLEPIPYDLDGAIRIFGSSVDIGAYEFQGVGQCSSGQFSTTGLDPCNPCPTGTYQPNTGQTSCLSCPAGFAQDSTGSFLCTPCGIGMYQPNTGQANCLSCSAGSVQASTGSVNCTACDSGTYQPNTGQTDCLSCPPGSAQASTGSVNCTSCSSGTYQPNTGQTNCLSCPPGSVQASSGSVDCTLCGSDTYQPNAGQATCLNCTCDDMDANTIDSCQSVTGDCTNTPLPPPVPTVTVWGIVVLLMTLLIVGSLILKDRAWQAIN